MYNQFHMGNAGELCAARYQFHGSRSTTLPWKVTTRARENHHRRFIHQGDVPSRCPEKAHHSSSRTMRNQTGSISQGCGS